MRLAGPCQPRLPPHRRSGAGRGSRVDGAALRGSRPQARARGLLCRCTTVLKAFKFQPATGVLPIRAPCGPHRGLRASPRLCRLGYPSWFFASDRPMRARRRRAPQLPLELGMPCSPAGRGLGRAETSARPSHFPGREPPARDSEAVTVLVRVRYLKKTQIISSPLQVFKILIKPILKKDIPLFALFWITNEKGRI